LTEIVNRKGADQVKITITIETKDSTTSYTVNTTEEATQILGRENSK